MQSRHPDGETVVVQPIGWRRAIAALSFVACALLPSSSAEAQYFGRNKIQYERFDFAVMETEHFDVYYYERERAAATQATKLAERWYRRLSDLFEHDLSGRQPLILYANHPDFAQTTAITGDIGEGTGGVTEALKRRIVLPMAGPEIETEHVIGHELVHAFQYDLSGISPDRPTVGSPTIGSLPLWMIEGMAEYYSVGAKSPLTAIYLRDALARDRLPTVQDLNDSRSYFPYRWGHALWAYVGGTWGARAPWLVLRESVRRHSIDAAFREVLGVSTDSLSAEWQRSIRDTYAGLDEVTEPVQQAARPLRDEVGEHELSLGPSLSPDGSKILFLSTRDPYAVDLYLADALTGKIVRRLTHSALDPHYQRLQFVNSAGDWTPDGERIVITTVSEGHAELVVLRASDGERIRVIPLDSIAVGAAFNPAVSPDGERVAFIGNSGGHLDLWTIGLNGTEPRRITSSAAAELHPTWTPDGREIVVATDRYGGYRLVAYDPSTGTARRIRTEPGADTFNPTFGPDDTLYYVAEIDGWRNVHRLEWPDGRSEPVTRLYGGVTGLTETSPALSVARASGRIAFTAFVGGRERIYLNDAPTRHRSTIQLEDGALLPPAGRQDGAITTALASRGTPPEDVAIERRDYRAGLSLDYLAPPSLGFSAGGAGTFVGGGTAAYFSDMLGRHELSTQLQVQIADGHVLDGIGALATYVNRAHRVHWGIRAGQVPQIAQAYGQGLQDVDDDGQPELVQRTLRFWSVSRQAMGLVQYPFNRTTRLELSAGAEHLGFDATSRREVFDLNTGAQLTDRTTDAPPCGDSLSVRRDLCEPGSLTEFRGQAALVHDNTLAGPTGPIAGQRARLELSPSLGTLSYVGALLDWRGYRRLASPLTLAGRLLHYGRYGSDASDQRLAQLFLGYPSLLRGYGDGSFDLRDCPPGQPVEDCSEVKVYSELFGNRLAVANAELRLSMFGPVGAISRASFLPVDLIAFFDAGVAWQHDDPATVEDDRASFLGGDHQILTSAGAGLRVNLLGFLLGDIYYVHPFDRPDHGGYVTLSLNAGF